MSAFRHSVSKMALLAALLSPAVGFAQLPGGVPGVGGAPGAGGLDADLSCAGRGADGELGCGDIGLEETLDLCEDKDGDYICDDQDECLDTPKDTPVFINGCHMVELTEGAPLVLRGVNFEFDKATLTQDSSPILDQAVGVLNTQPDMLVSIDGHTDSKGADAYNEQLSHDRAKAVFRYFIDAGVKRDRLVYRGFGESMPVAPNSLEDGSDNPVGRAENRRVELNIVDAETFAKLQKNIEAEEARLAARRAAAAAAAAAAAEAAAAEEAEGAHEEEAAVAEEPAEESATEEATASEGFDESQYLDFLSGDSESSESAESAEADASSVETGGADEAAVSEEESPAVSAVEFDESEYLDFLSEDAAAGAASEEAPAADAGSSDSYEEDPDYTLEVQPADSEQ